MPRFRCDNSKNLREKSIIIKSISNSVNWNDAGVNTHVVDAFSDGARTFYTPRTYPPADG